MANTRYQLINGSYQEGINLSQEEVEPDRKGEKKRHLSDDKIYDFPENLPRSQALLGDCPFHLMWHDIIFFFGL